jgi:hypothetical protein
MRRN